MVGAYCHPRSGFLRPRARDAGRQLARERKGDVRTRGMEATWAQCRRKPGVDMEGERDGRVGASGGRGLCARTVKNARESEMTHGGQRALAGLARLLSWPAIPRLFLD